MIRPHYILLAMMACFANAHAANVFIDPSVTVATIPETMFGGNLVPFESSGDDFGQPAYTGGVAAAQIAGLHNIRIPGGIWADRWDWEYAATGGDAWMVDVYEMLQQVTDIGGGAVPQAVVNFSGEWPEGVSHSRAETIQKAADWVQYMNVDNNYNVKLWEVGNEVYGNWHPNQVSGTTYGNDFVQFYNAMKARDPTIKVGAVAAVENAYQTFNQQMMAATSAQGVMPDFLAVHHYKDSDILGTSVNQAADFAQLFDGLVSTYYGPEAVGQVEYYMTEFRTRGQFGPAGDNRYTSSFTDAMFTLQYIMEMALHGWDGANIWGNKLVRQEGPPIRDYGLVERWTNDPYPTWYMYPFMTGYMGREMVQTTDDLGDDVRAYSTLDEAGDLVVAVVNNHEAVDQNITFTVSGASVDGSVGDLFEILPIGTTTLGLSGPPNLRMEVSINGVNDPGYAAVPFLAPQSIPVAQNFSLNIPANGLQFVKIPLAEITPLAGDFNANGVVDGADFLSWQKSFGAPPGTLPNDPDGGPIGAAQLVTWRTNYGTSASNASGTSSLSPVPEPTTAMLLAAGTVIVQLQRRRVVGRNEQHGAR